jgi:hypothetical protein
MHASSPNDSKTEAMARFIADQATMLEWGDVTNVNDFFARINQLIG